MRSGRSSSSAGPRYTLGVIALRRFAFLALALALSGSAIASDNYGFPFLAWGTFGLALVFLSPLLSIVATCASALRSSVGKGRGWLILIMGAVTVWNIAWDLLLLGAESPDLSNAAFLAILLGTVAIACLWVIVESAKPPQV